MGSHFFWDPVEDNIIQERDDTSAVTVDYTTEPSLYGDLISQRRDSATTLYCFDGQGNTRVLTDLSGNVSDSYIYTAFGEVTERVGTTTIAFQFAGRQQCYKNANTGDYLARRRTYKSV